MENFSTITNSPWPQTYENPPTFLPYWFENFDPYNWKSYMISNPNVSWYACIIYLTTIFSLQAYMKNRPAIKANKVMIAWNGFLAIFSLIGFYRISQEVFTNLAKPDGYYRSVCVREGRNIPADFWGLLFALSKFLEFGDTIFIVLRKQPLIPLQYYHHCIVTIFAWKLYPWGEPILAYYATVNFGVHAIMYGYFAAKGLKLHVPEFIAMTITTLQILQMIINTGNNVYTVAMLHLGHPCNRHPTSIKWSLAVYISLWILFAKFFLDRYYSNRRVKPKFQ